jgi:hypothetical protein
MMNTVDGTWSSSKPIEGHGSRYPPLRVLVHSGAEGNAIYSTNQASTAFAGLGVPQVAAAGRLLDRKVARCCASSASTPATRSA